VYIHGYRSLLFLLSRSRFRRNDNSPFRPNEPALQRWPSLFLLPSSAPLLLFACFCTCKDCWSDERGRAGEEDGECEEKDDAGEEEEEGQPGRELFANAGSPSFFKKALTIRRYCSQGETSCRENDYRRRHGARPRPRRRRHRR